MADRILVDSIRKYSNPSFKRTKDTLFIAGGELFRWFIDGVQVQGYQEGYLKMTDNATYWCTVFDENSCTHDSVGFTNYTATDVINQEIGTNQLLVIPSPATSEIELQHDNIDQGVVTIYDILGRIVFVGNSHGYNTRVDVSHFARGVYSVMYVSSNEIRRAMFSLK